MMSQAVLFEVEAEYAGAEARRLEQKYAHRMREELRMGPLVSYVGNKEVPLLRLYRYKEAFTFRFVDEWLTRFGVNREDTVFDPFCGMGTTLLAASCRGISAIGTDRLPVAVLIARTLPLFFQVRPGELTRIFECLQHIVPSAEPAPVAADVAIMGVAFSPDTLLALRRWKAAIDGLESPFREIFLLLFFSVLEPCSYTSKDGQFLRLKRTKRPADPEEALAGKVQEAETDIRWVRELGWDIAFRPFRVILGDTRRLDEVPFDRPPTVIITSPPYANRYDYTRTYSLELCFHFVRNFDELRELRHSLLRSHIEARLSPTEEAPHPAVRELVDFLRARGKALNNPRIPDMLTAYFVDMQKAIREWRRVLAPSARVAMVVDNVRFEGRMLPVDLILSEMAEEEGFAVEEIVVARYKGNSSQQMGRYGRVPVRESIVVWRKQGWLRTPDIKPGF
ncbi:MAG: DNA methyltransferase [Anaerolineae bacterium]|jgi:SAM-dependent methyltransferase